jgi:hypothetical protein
MFLKRLRRRVGRAHREKNRGMAELPVAELVREDGDDLILVTLVAESVV